MFILVSKEANQTLSTLATPTLHERPMRGGGHTPFAIDMPFV